VLTGLYRKAKRRLADESGNAIVIAVVLTGTLVLGVTLVTQTGDWLEHRRHLQVRADAAALAGGQVFGECFDAAFTAATAESDMHEWAKRYAGFASTKGTAMNTQYGGGSDPLPAFHSTTYSGGGGGSDDTLTGNECSTMQLDVKLTDANIPPLFSFVSAARVHAHARVQAQTIQSFKGSFPLAIPEVEPKFIAATFVDEATGNELTGCGATGRYAATTCTYLLTKGATANNLTSWTVSGSPNLPAVTSALGKRVGIRIGMGGAPMSCAGTAGNDNWACFDANASSLGAVMIRDYAAGSGGAAQPAAPILRSVLPTNSCAPATPPGFGTSPFVSDAGGLTTCSVGVSARIDFGTGATNPTLAQPGGVKAIATAVINGSTITLGPVPASYDPATTTWLWTPASGSATVPVNDGGAISAYPVTMSWEEQDGAQGGNTCSTAGGNKCKGNFDGGAAVARITSGTSDVEGPIKLMSVKQGGTPTYSLTPGIQTVTVEIQIEASLGLTNPPVLQSLRLTHTGSRTTAVACDGSGNAQFIAAIQNGCKTTYQINASQLCPDPAPPAGPADCVPTKTGNLGTTVIKALDDRFAGCPANHWPDSSQPGDPRLITMMLTDFSALNGNGTTQVPVVNFAGFYVIGWSQNKCGAAWPFPGAEPSGGNIWGYFVKYASLTQIPSGTVCDPTQITPCVPVLVR
jgi:hypothetical protein